MKVNILLPLRLGKHKGLGSERPVRTFRSDPCQDRNIRKFA
jgi:hypothetical protein